MVQAWCFPEGSNGEQVAIFFNIVVKQKRQLGGGDFWNFLPLCGNEKSFDESIIRFQFLDEQVIGPATVIDDIPKVGVAITFV